MKRNTEAQLDGTKQVSCSADIQKTKYIFISRHQSGGKNHNTKTTIKSFEM